MQTLKVHDRLYDGASRSGDTSLTQYVTEHRSKYVAVPVLLGTVSAVVCMSTVGIAGLEGIARALGTLGMVISALASIAFFTVSYGQITGGTTSLSRCRIPAVTVGTIGVILTLSAYPVSRPGAFEGLAGGLRLMFTGLTIVAGVLFFGFAYWWLNRGRVVAPVTLLSIFVGIMVFWRLDAVGILVGAGSTIFTTVGLLMTLLPPLGMLLWARATGIYD